jgi:LPS export ABC transporter permease LptG/LPS export ABC transporter permease LptF
MRIIDRYVIRQVLMPFCIGLVVFTFVFIIRTLMEYVEPLVARGVPAGVLLRVILLLFPQALALSIPMSLLLGLLVAFGKLSSQREFVALQACGVSLRRLLVPVGFVSLLGWAATSYVMLEALPAANQQFRVETFKIIADRAEGEVKPRVFFDDFRDLVLYVRDVPPGGGWNGVFLADFRPGQPRAVYVARSGAVVVNREAETIELVLNDVFRHTPDAESTELSRYQRVALRIDSSAMFPRGGPAKSDNEMTIAELREKIQQQIAANDSTHNQIMAIHRKFSIPVACLVFGVIGLALGATNRRDGALGSFGLGIAVVFAYYIPLFLFPQMTKGGHISPQLAVWLPNILLGIFALVLFIWRDRVADQPIGAPNWLLRLRERFKRTPRPGRLGTGPLRILDSYVARNYARILLLTCGATVAVFYISTFIDLSDKMFKGTAPWYTVFEYLVFATPQFAYYILPLSVLIATLVTVGMLTSSSELVVMKACGISLYRATAPMLLCAALVGGTLFVLDATVLGSANRRAEALKDQIKGIIVLRPLDRPWIVGDEGDIYHIGAFDNAGRQFRNIEIWRTDESMTHLLQQTSAKMASYVGADEGHSPAAWRLEDGWTRTFESGGRPADYRPFTSELRELESAAFFAREPPVAEFMSFRELRANTERLAAAGIDVLEQRVDLARKIAFPFVAIIMTLIAIPFAVTIGRSGTMAGIGVGIALALAYWGALSISGALGAGGALAPALSAWAPNLIFGAGAVYLLLTVRT